MDNKKTIFYAEFALLVAIEAVFCFTPLGSLPAVGPIVATLAMIPIIVASELLNYKAGAALGLIAGFFSFVIWTFAPPNPAFAFVFTPFYSIGEMRGNFFSLLICFVPRGLTGVVSGLLCSFLTRRRPKDDILNYAIAAAAGSLTNTAGVLGGIWLFFGERYAGVANGAIYYLVGLTVLTSGIPEAIISAVVCPAVVKPITIITERY